MAPSLARTRIERSAPDDEDLAESLHGVMRGLLRRVHPILEAEGLSMGQFWTMHFVSSLGETNLTTVARQMAVTAPTACANVDGLVRGGFLRRERSEKDRRTYALTLTPTGRRAQTRIWRALATSLRGAAEEVRPSDLATTVRVFGQLRRGLEGRPIPVATLGEAA